MKEMIATSETIAITRNGSQASIKGPAEWFSGSVRIDMLFQPQTPARTAAALVTFEPGSRTAWHTHPLGQTLLVTSGKGWVQEWGHEKHEIHPGDVVWFPPGVKHWHGASDTTALSHIAIQEVLDGKSVEWLEKVSDEQYLAEQAAIREISDKRPR
jgi:quercetin dioxygenase-like cupin family protein